MMNKGVILQGDVQSQSPKDYFDKGVEEMRMRKRISDKLNEEFNKRYVSMLWDSMDIDEVKG